MVFCVMVFSPFFHWAAYFAVWLFLDQVSPHWLTFSFPSTNDSCMYLPVCYDSEAFYHSGIFSSCHNCSTSFVDPHPPTCLQNLFSTLIVERCTWRAQVTILICSHLYKMPIFKCSLTHMSMSWIFSVFCEFCVNFECLKSPNITPPFEFGGWGGGRALCHLSSCPQIVNMGTLTISSQQEAWLFVGFASLDE